jgi:leucyl/phenylalanyl-tRNA---protein transferase
VHRANVPLDPETLLSAYAQGAFPMADRDGSVRWYTADPRGVFPLSHFHVPRSLRQIVRQNRFEIRLDHSFERVMRACAGQRQGGTWINEDLVAAYVQLHQIGFAHSVEAWQNDELAGGLYGVAMGGAFFGESMFHLRPNASKVALVHLVERLRVRGYELLDTQATTPHLRQFGCIDIPAGKYLGLLRKALAKKCAFI